MAAVIISRRANFRGAIMCIQIINLQISIVAKKLMTKEKIKIQDEDLGFHLLARDKSYMATSGPCKGTYFERVNVGFCRIKQVHFVFHPYKRSSYGFHPLPWTQLTFPILTRVLRCFA